MRVTSSSISTGSGRCSTFKNTPDKSMWGGVLLLFLVMVALMRCGLMTCGAASK